MNVQDNNSHEKDSFSTKIKKYFKNLIDFSNFDRKTIFYIIVFIAIMAITVYLLIYMIFIDDTILYRFVVEWIVNPIASLEIIGIFLFILVMAIQGIIVPLPSEVILIAAGLIYGTFGGAIMGIIGSLGAGLLCYYLSRKGGRPLARKFVGDRALNMADDFIHKYGIWAILIFRFIPFIPFDPVSYASGLVDMDVKKYSLGTFLGSIARAFFYAWLGDSFLGEIPGPPYDLNALDPAQFQAQANLFNIILLIIVAVLIIGFMAFYFYSRFWEKKKREQNLST
ncbi:MAG: TVP38/TMEM64 family protein [Candidatus Hermodarchaeota archaeon]